MMHIKKTTNTGHTWRNCEAWSTG